MLLALCRDTAKKEDIARVANEIAAGGSVGEDLIAGFLKGGSLRDIRTALQVFRDGGALAAWHAEHNPQAVAKEAPTVSPEAVAQFRRTHHVKAFVDAVKTNQIPVTEQPAYAAHVIAELTDNRPATKTGRARPEGFDGTVPPDERLTAMNIRRKVEQQLQASTRTPRQQAQDAARAWMTTLERSLTEMRVGINRAVEGLRSANTIATDFGDLKRDLSLEAISCLRDTETAIRRLGSGWSELLHHLRRETHGHQDQEGPDGRRRAVLR